MIKQFDPKLLKKLYVPSPTSHKGQNGRLMVIGGSHLFHAASLWSLEVASRIVDMVFYSSVEENNEIVLKHKDEFRNGIVVPREKLDLFMGDADVVLIGPGLPRDTGRTLDEESTRELTHRLLQAYPQKKWVIDAGSLTEMEASWLLPLQGRVIITPHSKEFKKLFGMEPTETSVQDMAKKYGCVILLKGPVDTVCAPFDSAQAVRGSEEPSGSRRGETCVQVSGGNPGMTKGGTGDVMAGLIAALACQNELYLAAQAGSYINKYAGESLFKRVGPYFNASDLANEIPKVMKELLLG